MGGDCAYRRDLDYSDVSIHAPAWGATAAQTGLNVERQFQSTPPHGGRPIIV